MLNECYESVFTKGCGERSSHAIVGLMSDAFKDPFYLRYKYRPNCAVHGITTTAPTTASTTTVTTSTRSVQKSVDERSDDARAFSDARASNTGTTGSKPPKRKPMTLLVSSANSLRGLTISNTRRHNSSSLDDLVRHLFLSLFLNLGPFYGVSLLLKALR